MAIRNIGNALLSALSTDVKPTNYPVNSILIETDTGSTYVYNGSTWALKTGGGGGGSPTYVSSFSYIIFKDASDGNRIKARNTTTGAIQYDNTAAQDTFNSVLTAMDAAGGGMALVKSGTYNIGARITPKNNTGLIGEHRQSTILNNTTNATDQSIFYYSTANPPSNVVLSHFTLENLSLHWNNGSETQAPWYSENTDYITFNNCHFKSFANPSVAKIMVYLASKAGQVTNTYARITNNIFEGLTNGQDQLGGGHYNSCLIANNTFIGDKSGTGVGQAIGCTRANGSRWIGNHFFNTGNIMGFEGDTCQNNIIADNVAIASGFIKLADVGNSTVNQSFRNVVTNNIQMYGNAGIRDGYGNDDVITNNLIWRTKSQGIKGTFNRCTIANNHISETNYDVFAVTVGGQSLRDGGIVLVNNTAWTGQKGNKIFGNTFYRQNTTPTFTVPSGYFDDAHAATYGRTGGILIDTNFDLTEAHDNIWVGTIASNEYIQNFGTNTRTRNNAGFDDDASTAAGDLLVGTGSAFVRKPRGTALQVFRTNSAGTNVEWGSLDNERVGKHTASGNASTTVFNIAHGLGSNPTYAFISVADCGSTMKAMPDYTTTSTNIVVTFGTPPESGTNNVVIYWRVVA